MFYENYTKSYEWDSDKHNLIAGADIILDFIGAPYWEKHSKCVAIDGRIVHLGFVSSKVQ